MIRQKWQGAPDCYFCGVAKDCDHLMFSLPVAKVVWGSLRHVLGRSRGPHAMINFGSGLGELCLGLNRFICWG
jgi:hypothetical protein